MKILVVVDMQNDFITGSLGTPEAEAIVSAVDAKIQEYANNGDCVVFTRDTHFDNYLETNEGLHLPVLHCIEGTDGWQITDAIYQPDNATVINKKTFGCYALPDCLMEWYINDPTITVESIELVGLCTDICVISNALILKSYFTNDHAAIPIKVDARCCAGVTPESHVAAITTMKMCQIEVEE